MDNNEQQSATLHAFLMPFYIFYQIHHKDSQGSCWQLLPASRVVGWPSCCSSERSVVTVGQSEADGGDGSEGDDGSALHYCCKRVNLRREKWEGQTTFPNHHQLPNTSNQPSPHPPAHSCWT